MVVTNPMELSKIPLVIKLPDGLLYSSIQHDMNIILLPALLIKCDGCRILEGIWVDYCFL